MAVEVYMQEGTEAERALAEEVINDLMQVMAHHQGIRTPLGIAASAIMRVLAEMIVAVGMDKEVMIAALRGYITHLENDPTFPKMQGPGDNKRSM